MRAHASVSDKEWGRRSTEGECYAGCRLRRCCVPGSTGRLVVDGKIFRNVQKASESHLPVDSVSIHGYGPKSGQQLLESLRIFIWQWCVGEIKLHYLFIRLLLRGTHSRRVCMSDMGWKHGYKDQCVEQSFIEE